MQATRKRETCRRRRSLGCVAGAMVLCAVLLGGRPPAAEADPPAAEPAAKPETTPKAPANRVAPDPKAGPDAKAEPGAQADPSAQAQSGAEVEQASPDKPKPRFKRANRTLAPNAVKRKGGKKSKRSAPFTMDPNAKWACSTKTVTLEPVWRAEKNLTFNFTIRNEGTADLRIKARGG